MNACAKSESSGVKYQIHYNVQRFVPVQRCHLVAYTIELLHFGLFIVSRSSFVISSVTK